MPAERLQKILAAAGIASRRKAEEIIAAGLVSVNGQTVTEPGTKADPAVDHIKVNGRAIKGAQRHVYILLHKPKGYVTTVSDPEGRPTVMDLVPYMGARLYPVGRLDYSSEGLLLLTNDGDLANRLTRAASHVRKTYLVKVSGVPSADAIAKLRQGVMIPEGDNPHDRKRVKTAPAGVRLFREGDNPWFEVTLIEGRNRQLRKMFEVVGHRVEKIKRVVYGPLVLDVEAGNYRTLNDREVQRLKAAASGKALPRSVEPAAAARKPRIESKKKPAAKSSRRH